MTNTLNKIIHNGDEYEFPRQKALVITLTSAWWTNNEQTVTATWVTANNSVIVSPAPSSITDYTDWWVYCSGQSTDSLTFACSTTPSNDIDVNVVVLSAEVGSTPTPPTPWQPWANTIAYFPLDSDLLDHSGNSFSVTTYGTVSIWTAGWVSAWDFRSVWELSWSVATTGSLTVLGYAYKTANPNNDNASMFGFGGWSMWWPICQALYWNTNWDSHISNKPWVALFDWDTQANQTAVSMNNNEWVHFAATFDWSTKVVKLYTNWVLSSQYTTSVTDNPNYLGMSRANWLDRSWIGYLSEVIFESKCWSAQEIADYYDQTKWDYWIS